MLQRIFSVLLAIFFISTVIHAQRPQNIHYEGTLEPPALIGARTKCTDNDAGTVSIGTPFNGQSNDVSSLTKPIYLCYGDMLPILHQGGKLDGDPIKLTPAGYGYAFYKDKPTIDGPNLATILTDPSIFNGPPPSIKGIYIYTEKLNGNITLSNDGYLQQIYNNNKPISLWFAPITFDELKNGNGEFEGILPSTGLCVSVSIASAFQVVYLNKIAESNVVQNADRSGTFTLKGGLPEWDKTSNFTIKIEENATSTKALGTVTSQTINADGSVSVAFNVPKDGGYRVTVSDGKSCDYTFSVGFPSITFSANNVTGTVGDVQCVDVKVKDYVNITNWQYTINWDPTVVLFNKIENLNTNLSGFSSASFSDKEKNNGKYGVAYYDPNGNPTTLADGETAFQICFTIIGKTNSSTPISFDGSLVGIDAGAIPLGTTKPVVMGVNFQAGSVTVSGVSATPKIALSKTDVKCRGDRNGKLEATFSGGQAPYVFMWGKKGGAIPEGSGKATQSPETVIVSSSLAGDEYIVTVTDNDGNGVSATASIIINEPAARLAPNFRSTIPPKCSGGTDGQIVIMTTGGTSPYSYEWTFDGKPFAAGINKTTLTNLAEGQYEVIVTDAQGCTGKASGNLAAAKLSLDKKTTPETCSGANNATITVTASGGEVANGTYNYKWAYQNKDTTAAQAILTKLKGGRYYLTITDDNKCQLIDSVDVTVTKGLQLTNITVDSVTCRDGNDGRIFMKGGTLGGTASPPYTFSWIPTLTAKDTLGGSLVQNLSPGIYAITMKDSDPAGCQITTFFTLNNPPALNIAQQALVNETCKGGDGSISLKVSGGSGIYNYNWSNGALTQNAINLISGTYSVTVTDSRSCSSTKSFVITAPDNPKIDQVKVKNVKCANGRDGSIEIVPNAPTTIASYAWTGSGSTSGKAESLLPGRYKVTITGTNGCRTIIDTALISPNLITLVDTILTSPNCPGDKNGKFAITVIGGTEPYQYKWSTGAISAENLLPGLGAGVYTVSVTDANNCPELIISSTLVDKPKINLNYSNIKQVTCFSDKCKPGNGDGSVTVTASGGTSAANTFSFQWSSGENDEGGITHTAVQLCQGYQKVTVTDENNCFVIDSVMVPAPPPVGISQSETLIENVSCTGLSDGSAFVVATGGVGGYDFSWRDSQDNEFSTSDRINNLKPGLYFLTITDANKCIFDYIIGIGEPDTLRVLINKDSTANISCYGLNDGKIGVSWTGGNPGLASYTWTNDISDNEFAQNLSAGIYIVTVMDSKGCSGEGTYTVVEPPQITATIPIPDPPKCNGYQTAIKVLAAAGGDGGPYDFTVDDGPKNAVSPTREIPVFAGEHIVKIFDGTNKCYIEKSLIIEEPPRVIVDLGADVEMQLGDSIRLNPIISSVFAVDSIIWTPETDLSCKGCLKPYASPLDDKTYQLMVWDENNCPGEDEIIVRVDKNRNVFIPNAFSPNGDGTNDEFRVFAGVGVEKITSMAVFDRWGELLYSSQEFLPGESLSKRWDGYFRGRLMESGVYVYIIEVQFLDGIKLTYRGDVTLLR